MISEDARMKLSNATKLDKLGRIWVTNGHQTKQIRPIELYKYLKSRWVKGRKVNLNLISPIKNIENDFWHN